MLLVQFGRKLCTISQASESAPNGSRLRLLSIILKTCPTLCLCPCGPSSFSISNNGPISGVALRHFNNLLAPSRIGVPYKRLDGAFFLSIVFEFFRFDSALWTHFTEPN